MRGTDLTGLLGHLLLWGQLGFVFPVLCRLSGRRRGLILLAGLGLAWLTGLVYVARGVIGDLSVVTQLLLVLSCLRGFGLEMPATSGLRRPTALGVVFILVILYSSALGYVRVDLYSEGYQPRGLLIGLAVALALCWRWQRGLALALLAGLAAWECGWLESTNLWDYLADPLLLLGAVFRVGVAGRQTIREPADGERPALGSTSSASQAA